MELEIINAVWSEEHGQYMTEGANEWYSNDGDEWEDESGLPVESPEFRAATIRLTGGPLDGETVS